MVYLLHARQDIFRKRKKIRTPPGWNFILFYFIFLHLFMREEIPRNLTRAEWYRKEEGEEEPTLRRRDMGTDWSHGATAASNLYTFLPHGTHTPSARQTLLLLSPKTGRLLLVTSERERSFNRGRQIMFGVLQAKSGEMLLTRAWRIWV